MPPKKTNIAADSQSLLRAKYKPQTVSANIRESGYPAKKTNASGHTTQISSARNAERREQSSSRSCSVPQKRKNVAIVAIRSADANSDCVTRRSEARRV